MIDHNEKLKNSTNYGKGCRCMNCVRWNRAQSAKHYYLRQGKLQQYMPPPPDIVFANGPLRGQQCSGTEARMGTVTVEGHQYGSHQPMPDGRMSYVWLRDAS